MRDVAREAGVAVGTVSRVMNHEPGVKPASRALVEQAAARLGWKPNSIAASMRTSSSRTIGCVFSDIRNPLFAAIERSAEALLREHGYTLIVANTDDDLDLEKNILDLMFRRRIEGLIFAPSHESDPTITSMLQAAEVPVVLIEREWATPIDSVVSDQFGGMFKATEYLLSLGHRDIAIVTGNPQNRPGRERLRGYQAALSAAGLQPNPDLMRLDSLTSAYAFQAVQALLALPKPPSAIMMGGNLMLAGAMRALALASIDVPRDISMIAVGDTDLAELAQPSYTAVRWDLDQIGREAAAILLSRLGAEPAEHPVRNVLVGTEIVLRKSCRVFQG